MLWDYHRIFIPNLTERILHVVKSQFRRKTRSELTPCKTQPCKDAHRPATRTLQLCLKVKPSRLQIMLYPQRPGRCQTQTRSINGGEGRLSFEVLHFIIGSIIYSVTFLYINLRSAFLFTPRKHIKFRQRTLGFPFICKSLVNTGYLHERSSWVHTHTHIHK